MEGRGRGVALGEKFFFIFFKLFIELKIEFYPMVYVTKIINKKLLIILREFLPKT